MNVQVINVKLFIIIIRLVNDNVYDENCIFLAEVHHVKAIDDSMLYTHRHSSLSEWSPFELTMGFVCNQDNTADSKLFPLRGDLGRKSGYAHKPRLDRAKIPAIAIPQPMKEHPKRPSVDAPTDMKEEYAAWALGNFYSDRLLHKLYPLDLDRASDEYEDEDLRDVSTLWSLFRRWERRRPRGDKDEFAFRCLHNIELRLEARSQMREDSNKMRVLRRQLVADEQNVEHDSSVSFILCVFNGYARVIYLAV